MLRKTFATWNRAVAARNYFAPGLAWRFHIFSNPISRFLLTPCFSWVWKRREKKNRFNGLSRTVETVETVPTSAGRSPTQLKQGVNERDFELRSGGYEIYRLAGKMHPSCIPFRLISVDFLLHSSNNRLDSLAKQRKVCHS